MEPLTIQRIATLHPAIRDEVTRTLAALQLSQGTSVRVTQALRTFQEQDELYAKGRTAPGKRVTNAKGGQSIHNFGLAFDYVLLRHGAVSWTVDADWKKVAQAFMDKGWEWGGHWRSLKDYPHLEKTFGYSWQALLKKHNSGDFIAGTQFVNL